MPTPARPSTGSRATGVNGPKDFAGRKIGNPPGDASRVMWPAFAKAVGLAPEIGLLRQCRADREVGGVEKPDRRNHQRFLQFARYQAEGIRRRSGSLNWKDIGLNSYGNSLIVNGLPEKNPKLVGGFRSYHAEGLCRLRRRLRALPEGAARPGHRSRPRGATAAMGPHQISDGAMSSTTTKALLAGSTRARMRKDLRSRCRRYLGIEKPFAVETSFTSKLLDPAVKMDASKVRNRPSPAPSVIASSEGAKQSTVQCGMPRSMASCAAESRCAIASQ